jgi:CNT family concentrative nucleoside transporter
MSILYHLGIMQAVVKAVAWVMVRTMGTSGAESLSAAANIFVGQTEAPLVVRPYVAQMTRSELMAVMTGGFATIAGGVMAAYVAFGIDAGHLLTASVISAPASLVMAKLMEPETEEPLTKGTVRVTFERTTVNLIDAAAVGAADGLRLAFNVAAMLVAFLALLAMINAFLGWLDKTFISLVIPLQGRQPLSLETLLGYLFAPLAFLLGTPTQDVLTMGSLMGIKVAANEFVAYVRLADLKDTIDPRTFVLATYALCGFANFGSIAIQIGGISAIAPERRADLARLGLKAMWAGALATWLTACVAGTLISERKARWRYLVDLSKRTEQVKVFVQPYEIAKEFANSANPKERELAEEVLEKLKERAKRLWDETEQKVQRLLKEGKRNEAIKAYEDFARQIAFPEWQRKAWEKAKSLREQQGG